MRSLFLLFALAFAAPSFAANENVYGCIGILSGSVFPKPTLWASLGDARSYCDTRAAWASPSSVTESATATTTDGIVTTNYVYQGSCGTSCTRSYMVIHFACVDPSADYSMGECVGGETSLTNEDIAVYVGYVLGAFGLGFAMGYLFRVFYKAVDMI
jgi:hypothetical protein